MLPSFIIIGAQKSASTFLQQCISEHPDVYIPKGEISFFEDPDYKEVDPECFWVQFDGVAEGKIFGIKRPTYLGKLECTERIRNLIPNVKLICVLRNPVKRAISAYYHYIRTGFIPPVPINDGIPLILQGKWSLDYQRSDKILRFGLYHKHLSHYLKFFTMSQLFICLNEDVQRNSKGVVRDIYRFLNIDENYCPSSLNKHPMKGVYTLWRLRLWHQIMNKYMVYNQNKTRCYYPKNYWSLLIIFSFSRFDRHILSRFDIASKDKLESDIEYELYSYYLSDIKSTERLLGFNLELWRSKK